MVTPTFSQDNFSSKPELTFFLVWYWASKSAYLSHCGPHPVMVSGLGKNPSWHVQTATPLELALQTVFGPHGDGLHASYPDETPAPTPVLPACLLVECVNGGMATPDAGAIDDIAANNAAKRRTLHNSVTDGLRDEEDDDAGRRRETRGLNASDEEGGSGNALR